MPRLTSFKNRDDFNEWYSKYRLINKEKLRIYNKEYIRKYREKNGEFQKQKDRCRSQVSWALKIGTISKGTCCVCDSIIVEAHHEDYSKPLEVIWFCRKHHRQQDVRTGKRKS